MNSRGKQLTQFEKIKSGLDGLVDNISHLPEEGLFSQENKDSSENIQKNCRRLLTFGNGRWTGSG